MSVIKLCLKYVKNDIGDIFNKRLTETECNEIIKFCDGKDDDRYSCLIAYANRELKNYSKAKELYKMAIEKGNSFAMNNLGYMFHNGEGVERNYSKAIELYKMAIEKGNSFAMNSLGYMFHNGLGVEQNRSKATELYKMAIEKGNSFAMYNLGYMYAHGEDAERNYSKAIELYKKAIEKGDHVAMNNFKTLYEKVNDVDLLELYKSCKIGQIECTIPIKKIRKSINIFQFIDMVSYIGKTQFGKKCDIKAELELIEEFKECSLSKFDELADKINLDKYLKLLDIQKEIQKLAFNTFVLLTKEQIGDKYVYQKIYEYYC
jgi:tetratricopeptide (TPR) repeat protein